jgi:hypothetical protein
MTPDQASDLAVDIVQHPGWGKGATPIDRWAKTLAPLDHDRACRVLNSLATTTTAPTLGEFMGIYQRLGIPTTPHQTCPTCAGSGRIFEQPIESYDRTIPEDVRQTGLEQLRLIKEQLHRGT